LELLDFRIFRIFLFESRIKPKIRISVFWVNIAPMKNTILLFALFSVLLYSCSKLDLYDEASKCIERKISTESKEGKIKEVYKFTGDGKEYYYFVSTANDGFNDLYDAECNFICSPDGGIAGTGRGTCPEFNERTPIVLIWEK
jgi:hypothetical protein